jgi:uncharacterized protein YndB with AHSA1/START domain
MSPIMVRDDEILQEVTIQAPAERIFAALTRPDELLKWWAAEGKFQLVHAECDLQSGGRWLMRVVGNCAAESSDSTVCGEYRDVEPPRLLTYTWIRENEDARALGPGGERWAYNGSRDALRACGREPARTEQRLAADCGIARSVYEGTMLA